MNNTGVTGLTAKKKKTLSNISREISIEHPSVGLASLAQSREISIEHPSVGLASLAQSREISIEHPSVGLASLAQLCISMSVCLVCQINCVGGIT